jgi:hypothetical protein
MRRRFRFVRTIKSKLFQVDIYMFEDKDTGRRYWINKNYFWTRGQS